MSERRVIVVGGGAAGFFAAIACAEAAPETEVWILEKSARLLEKVRISGGGRCNVTHACFEPREFATRYPRGGTELLSPFQTFSARDTIAWFADRGVPLKTERDGRMFPITDDSQTIVDCLLNAARSAGVQWRLNTEVAGMRRRASSGFEVKLATGAGSAGKASAEMMVCDAVLLATGGCRAAAAGQLATSLGHTLEAPVPSLFTFHVATTWLRELAGISVEQAEVSALLAKASHVSSLESQSKTQTVLRERGAILITHWGLSGPVILRLSAWGARPLCAVDYQFPLLVNWLPQLSVAELGAELSVRRSSQPSKFIVNTPLSPLPARLWEQLVASAGIPRDARWSSLSRTAQHQLTLALTRTEFPVTGKSLNKDEFVTCGGVRLREVNFKTMESRVCPGLYFAGELLDIDGLTGGFNFQAAWTTGWLAGQALAARGTRG